MKERRAARQRRRAILVQRVPDRRTGDVRAVNAWPKVKINRAAACAASLRRERNRIVASLREHNARRGRPKRNELASIERERQRVCRIDQRRRDVRRDG